MNGKLLTAIALAATPFLWPSAASANLIAEFSLNGGLTFTTICSGTSGTSCSGSTTTPNGIVLTIESAASNAPGTPHLADLLSAVVDIDNSKGVTESVQLRIGDTSFTQPVAPPETVLESAIGTTVVTGSSHNALTYQSCVDQANAQDACPGTFATPFVSPDITAIGSDHRSDSINIASLTPGYSVTEELNLTLGAGSIINYSASTRLTSTVPEPASLAVLGSALVGFGWLRRRRKTA